MPRRQQHEEERSEKLTARFGDREVEFDVRHALEAYRRIRAGSLQGAATTRALVAFAKQALGPGWKGRLREMVMAGEDEERQREEEERASTH